MPSDDQILDYATPRVAPKHAMWRRMLLLIIAAMTLIICFIYVFAAIDAWSFAHQLKRHGKNPTALPLIEAGAVHNTQVAVAVLAIATAGWTTYFALSRRSQSQRQLRD